MGSGFCDNNNVKVSKVSKEILFLGFFQENILYLIKYYLSNLEFEN